MIWRSHLRRTVAVTLFVICSGSCALQAGGSGESASWFHRIKRIANESVRTRAAIFFAGQQGRWTHLIAWSILFATYDNNTMATASARKALKVAESTFGRDDARAATSLHYLAVLYEGKRRYADAEPLVRRALAIREKSLGAEDPSVSDQLVRLADLYSRRQDPTEAEQLYIRALHIREKAFGSETVVVADVLNKLAALYIIERRYSDAEKLCRQALQVKEKALGTADPDLADTLRALAALSIERGQYGDAEALYLRAIQTQETGLEPDDPAAISPLTDLAALYDKRHRAAEAAALRQRVAHIQELVLGFPPGSGKNDRERRKRLASLVSRSFTLFNEAEYADKIQTDQESIRFVEATFGAEDWRVSLFLVVLAEQYWSGKGAYSKTESLFRRAMRIQEKTLGTEEPSLAETLTAFARFYAAELRYSEAIELLQRAIRIQEKTMCLEVPEDTYMHNPRALLADIYRRQGKASEAEALFTSAQKIVERNMGAKKPSSYAMARILMNLAGIYMNQGRFTDAEPLILRAIDLDGKAWGPGWIGFRETWVGEDVSELARDYELQNNYVSAEPLYRRALSLTAKGTGQRSVQTAEAEWALARNYILQAKYDRAEELLLTALRREERLSLSWQGDRTAGKLAQVYLDQGRYAEAKVLLKQSLKIEEANLDPDSPDLANTLARMGVAMFGMAQPAQADLFFDRSFAILDHRLQYYFQFMSESDRLLLLNTIRYQLALYFSFAERFRQEAPQLTARMYDLVLRNKGLVGHSIELLRRRVAASGNSEAVGLLNELATSGAQISVLMNHPAAGSESWRKTIAILKEKANDLDRKLSRAFPEKQRQQNLCWQQIREALKAAHADAAIEFVRFPFHDGRKWTDSAHYAALVITPASELPALVSLGEASELERDAVKKDYRQLVESKVAGYSLGSETIPGQLFYDAFWRPLEPLLSDAKTLYVSPDGLLDQISLGVIPAENGEPLLAKYDLRLVAATRDLLDERRDYTGTTALLIGNPNFALKDDQYPAALLSLHLTRNPKATAPAAIAEQPVEMPSRARSRELTGTTLSPLPGTAAEIGRVAELLEDRGWQVSLYRDDRAIVEAIQSVPRPRVLYLATHGFFEPDQGVQRIESLNSSTAGIEYSMLRSGLFFAGADRALQKKTIPEGQSDGMMTAYEASLLNLDGTEMVVLSACETGMGKVEAGEGVFGLLRAFREAGADSVVVSMWKVPDLQTRDLMTSFYENWLSGIEKHEALRKAQLTLRDRIKEHFSTDLPYYWGAFVLVGR